MNFLNRIKNYGFWVSLASLVLLLLQNSGVHIVDADYNAIVNAILTFLIAAGIVNNPTTSTPGFGDDPAEEQKEDETKTL